MNVASQTTHGAMPDLLGRNYHEVLRQLHLTLAPKTYLEIGVHTGRSFGISRCASIGIDPGISITDPAILEEIIKKPCLMLFNMPSDAFFERYRPTELLGRHIELAFLDGMHRCEFLLRDFMNTESNCRSNSVIALHDCLPPDPGITARTSGQRRSLLPHRFEWWAGDVWRTSLLLRRYRPDLRLTVLDAAPTGLVLITNLDPENKKLAEGYASYVEEMLSWDLDKIGVASLFEEMKVEPTSAIEAHEQLTARFWL